MSLCSLTSHLRAHLFLLLSANHPLHPAWWQTPHPCRLKSGLFICVCLKEKERIYKFSNIHCTEVHTHPHKDTHTMLSLVTIWIHKPPARKTAWKVNSTLSNSYSVTTAVVTIVIHWLKESFRYFGIYITITRWGNWYHSYVCMLNMKLEQEKTASLATRKHNYNKTQDKNVSFLYGVNKQECYYVMLLLNSVN